MLRNILILWILHTTLHADFMDSVANVIESTLGDDGVEEHESVMTEKSSVEGMFSFVSIFTNTSSKREILGSEILGESILGDAKDMSQSLYKGFKYTGESTELMSGIVYKSAKVYNGMFDIVDGTVLTLFEDEEEKETSLLDLIDQGNDILDIFN